MTKTRALIAMSGGVDSSVAARLMLDAGYECIGCTMKLYSNEDANISKEHSCCSLDDVEDARSVARVLGMPHYVMNFSRNFKEKIIDKFVFCYENGITPNPCVDCNRIMKFDELFRRGQELGCEYVVTGHYARVEKAGDRYLLKKALDPAKDQSYVLYSLTQEQLAHVQFPLGGLSKPEVRALAEAGGFINADKPDSQDICFVPDGDYAAVIEHNTGRKSLPGDFIDTATGKAIGRHQGIIHYTVGQHRGLGLGYHEKLYVTGIDAKNNAVLLGREKDLYATDFLVKDVNWISGEVPEEPVRCLATVRYHRREQPATVEPLGGSAYRIRFDTPQRTAAPGQAAVFYEGDIVLGGGTIYTPATEQLI